MKQAIAEPGLVAALEHHLKQPGHSADLLCNLAPVLDTIAFQRIDRLLQEIKTITRQGAIAHAACARFGRDVIVLWDPDPQFDWLLPAVKNRLSEALAGLPYEIDLEKTQVVDFSRGQKLRFLGFELRLARPWRGPPRIHCRRIDKPDPAQGEAERPAQPSFIQRLPRVGVRWPLPGLGRRLLSWIGAPPRAAARLVQGLSHRAPSVQVGWRHLPILLYPVLALYFGWLSPIALACVASILVANRRSIPALCVQALRHPLEMIAAVCGIALVVCLSLLVSDLCASLPREAPAAHMPAGFFLGRYQPSWDGEPVRYGLYVPPHFSREKGPFPLIVFLHGYGERGVERFLAAGLPQSIVVRFGEDSANGRFQFAAFFPVDPRGLWELDGAESDGVIEALDHVIKRHRIDRTRVYLTGHSTGGDGVWLLAQAYPEKWAAVAPVSAFTDPDVARVGHLPAWIFHAAADRHAPVERERVLVRKLQDARADVRYTEIPNQGHIIWHDVYDSKPLYEWFAAKTRP